MPIPKEDIVIARLGEIIPLEKLAQMRSLDEVHPYLPVEIGGLKISVFEERKEGQRDLIRQRTGVVRTLSNTPAMGGVAKRFSPFAIWRLFKERFSAAKGANNEYPDELREWEGISESGEVTQTGRGHTNPFHLLDQMIQMGPTGDEYKRGPAPIPWNVHELAVQDVIAAMSSAGLRAVEPAHMVLCTEDSTGRGIPFAMLKDKSAAQPFIGWEVRNPKTGQIRKAHKGEFISEAVNLARRLFRLGTNSLNMYPGTVFKRYDRPAPIAYYADTEVARNSIVLGGKDRAIIAQPYPSQVAEATVLRPIQVGIQQSAVENLDVRTQYHTSLVFQNMTSWVQQVSEEGLVRYTIGVDESGWDHHMTPQGWYSAFQICKALLPETLRIGWIEGEEFIIFGRDSQARLEAIKTGTTSKMTVRYRTSNRDGTVAEWRGTALAGMEEIDTDTYLRKVFAQCSGNDILISDILLSGYKHVLETPNDGKVMLGFGMRSGNWGTFLNNSLVNWYKTKVYERMAEDPTTRQAYRAMYGYDLPTQLRIDISLFRGDDSALCVEVDSAFSEGDVPISQLFADLIKFTGGKANAKKQETSDTPGRSLFGFAQQFVSEEFPSGVSGISRVMERMIYREEDEATGIDPLTGEDLRHLIGDMGNWARLMTLTDAFGKTKHPLMELVFAIWQDLDLPEDGDLRRMLPPADEAERRKLSNLFYSRLLRRGQAPPGAEDLLNIWNTELGPFLEKRFADDTKLRSSWTPIQGSKTGDDRTSWRARIK